MSTNQESKKDDEKPQEPPFKKTCIQKRVTPDLVIVVGGEEFEEYSQSICCWSDYFDTALDSGMKETESMRFEFPDRDPREWEWIVSLMAPMAKETVTEDKLDVALSWFDELCSNVGLEQCDGVIHAEVVARLSGRNTRAALLMLQSLEKSTHYGLRRSTKSLLELILEVITQRPQSLSRDMLQRIVSLVKNHEDSRSELLSALQAHLPKSLPTEQQETLLDQGVLHHILFAQIRMQHFEVENQKSQKRATQAETINSTIVEAINSASTICFVSDLRYELKRDPAVGHFF